MIAQERKSEVVGVQFLRAAAAILVVMHHALHQLPALQAMIPTEALQGGVDIFFVISGFIMTYTVALKPLTAGYFLEKRVVRIVPLYWAMTFITAALALVLPRIFKDTTFTTSGLLTSLFFIPTYSAGKVGEISPLLKLGWTLNYEAFFYVIFAALIFLAPLRRSLTLLAFFVACALFLPMIHSSAAPIVFYSNPITLEFVAGCFIGAISASSTTPRVPVPAAAAILVVAVACFLYFGNHNIDGFNRVLNLGLSAAAIVFSVVQLDLARLFDGRGFIQRSGKLLGDASYSMYLAHLYPVIGLRWIWEHIHLPITGVFGPLVYLVMATAGGIGTGLLVYYVIEKPLTKRARVFIGTRSRTRLAST
jgi:exopolysaccharide production protein ExoZ